MSVLLELNNVVKDFGGLRAVNGVSFGVERGKIIGLLGPNGSGKSTLINVISGTISPDGGQIIFDGHDISRASPDAIYARGLARGFQEPGLFFQMTALDNTLLPAKHQRGERAWSAPFRRLWKPQEDDNARKAHGALSQVEIDGLYSKSAAELSGGQMKLLEIGRSLMGDPKMMLLDEPTAGVAPKLAAKIFQHIAQMNREQGITFLIVEHRLELLFEIVDSVIVMHMGAVLARGTPDEIARNATVREVYLGG